MKFKHLLSIGAGCALFSVLAAEPVTELKGAGNFLFGSKDEKASVMVKKEECPDFAGALMVETEMKSGTIFKKAVLFYTPVTKQLFAVRFYGDFKDSQKIIDLLIQKYGKDNFFCNSGRRVGIDGIRTYVFGKKEFENAVIIIDGNKVVTEEGTRSEFTVSYISRGLYRTFGEEKGKTAEQLKAEQEKKQKAEAERKANLDLL